MGLGFYLNRPEPLRLWEEAPCNRPKLQEPSGSENGFLVGVHRSLHLAFLILSCSRIEPVIDIHHA